ncbi:tetratricopeptide repeat protein [Winogradskyella immobilis]|uniref:Tetratricopeptide repeat protein n=1 Tax=Winogradskyella immobilis TaxID=2816852 RepID=A0ABS8ENX9_9FLAO|nr:tetratricopeptide repeat protein [Winogradskyella immobilis]MCC1484727.1 tetratricopeptide repeat protein [Winogradskyella immobilis]MCG0016819.1 tetratricopeptide repeat protein [Winogradskyella immobilis]
MKSLLILLFFPIVLYAQVPYDAVESLISEKQFAKAEKLIAPYVTSNTKDLKAIELLGDAHGHQKNWDEAIKNYKRLKELSPSNANYHYKYGGALGMKALNVNKFKALGIIGDVKEAFLEAAELDAKHIDTRWALVELYMSLPGIVGGSKKKSLKYANELEQLSLVDGYLAKGYIYEYDDEPKLAETYYKKAIEVGGSINCFEKLTNLYESQQQPDKAISNIEVAQKKHKRNALHYQIGKVCADYNVQLDKGERCLMRYIENYSAADGVPKEWAYYRLAQIYKHKNDKNKAIEYIDKALEIRSDFKQALREKSTILSK